MVKLRKRAHEMIDNISEKKIAQVVDYLEFLRVKEEVEATNEIMSDSELVKAIQKGISQMNSEDLVRLEDVVTNA